MTIVSTLSEAMALIDKHSWAGAVVDYRLNGEDYAILCEHLLSQAIPFAIYSALSEVEVPSARSLHIMKPANPDDIVHLVEELSVLLRREASNQRSGR